GADLSGCGSPSGSRRGSRDFAASWSGRSRRTRARSATAWCWAAPASDPVSPFGAPRRIAVGDVEINAAVAGSGPPLLLLHGYPATHRMWLRPRAQLGERG